MGRSSAFRSDPMKEMCGLLSEVLPDGAGSECSRGGRAVEGGLQVVVCLAPRFKGDGVCGVCYVCGFSNACGRLEAAICFVAGAGSEEAILLCDVADGGLEHVPACAAIQRGGMELVGGEKMKDVVG